MSPDALPDGTVTFLLTDVESSSVWWDADPDRTDGALATLGSTLAEVAMANAGAVIKSRGEGDSAFLVFARASAAIVAAYELQLALARRECPLRVRSAIHTGETRLRDGDYLGAAVNRTARLRSLAHGGQTVVSRIAGELAESELPREISLVPLGTYRIRDWPRTEQIFGLRGPGLENDFPPLRVWGDAQRALMTIVAVDIVGSHKVIAGLTDAELVEAHRSWWGLMRQRFAQHRGSFLRVVGDGCLAAFDDPTSAVRFAQSLRSELDVKIAIHAGLVELLGDDIVGRPLFEAFRLLTLAGRGEIVASPTLCDLLAGSDIGFQARDGGSIVTLAPA